jgi:putative ABC transport system permease protein
VQNACVVSVLPIKIGTSVGNTGFDIDNIMSVSAEFFGMFSTRFVLGDPSKPLPNPNSVVLTESSARKLFGNLDPLGKEIVVWHMYTLTVTGVIKDFPENSSINANMIVNMENNNFKFSRNIGNSDDSSTYRYPFNIYLQLVEKSDARQLAGKLNSHPEILQPFVKKAGLLSLTDTYLRDNTTESTTKKGNPALLRLFMGIALVVLVLAIVNYVNLSIAQQNKRNKETGIRKTIGAGRKDIVYLFLTESVLVTFIAFAIALVITEISLPFFGRVVDTQLRITPLAQFPENIILFLSIFFIGTVAGIVPALLFSSFNPARALSGKRIASGRKGYFRNLLTVFQFTVSIALIICIVVIQRQISFAEHEDLGFNKDQLLRIDLPFSEGSKAAVLVNGLRKYPAIKSITLSSGVPGDIHMYMGSGISGKEKHLSCMYADSNFITTFGVPLVKGRELLPGDLGQVCMINETAYNYFGWNDLTNRRYDNGRKGGFEVVGVVKDFHIASLHQPIEPMCIMFYKETPWPSNCTVRIWPGATAQAMACLQKEWKEVFPDYPLDYQFYDEWFNQMYAKDERFANAIGMFAFLAVTISCLGILGLSIFSSERRAKEIGIRKVHGATVRELMILLNKDFMKWVAIAFVIACPLGWYAMDKWLQDFAYKTELSWWIFTASGLSALLIASLTVSWQTWRASTRNPVEVLRYE